MHTAFSTGDKLELRVGGREEKLWRRDKIVDSGVDTYYVQEYISTTDETETKT